MKDKEAKIAHAGVLAEEITHNRRDKMNKRLPQVDSREDMLNLYVRDTCSQQTAQITVSGVLSTRNFLKQALKKLGIPSSVKVNKVRIQGRTLKLGE